MKYKSIVKLVNEVFVACVIILHLMAVFNVIGLQRQICTLQ